MGTSERFLDSAELAAIVAEVVRTHRLVHESVERRKLPGGRAAWSDAAREFRDAVDRFETFADVVEQPLRDREPGSISRAIEFLEFDPWCFRSGYAKGRLLRRLARAELTVDERDRLVGVVLTYVDRGGRGEFRDATGLRLGGARLRNELRRRLHGDDVGVARRALLALLDLRRPRLTTEDIRVARALVLAEIARPVTPSWARPTWPLQIADQLDPASWVPELIGDIRADPDDAHVPLTALAAISNVKLNDGDKSLLTRLLLEQFLHVDSDRWIEGIAVHVDSPQLRIELRRLQATMPNDINDTASWALNAMRRAHG